jgi:4'-phosphopantetheinyl transferase
MKAGLIERPATRVARRPQPRGIGPREVHLWTTSFARLWPQYDALKASLSDDERERAERYHQHDDCLRFILGRGRLRGLLEMYSGVPAQSLAFSYGPFGRPGLQGEPGVPDIRFSVSHTSSLIVFLFARGCEVGVDVEAEPYPGVWADDFSSLLSARESKLIDETPESGRARMLLTFWTRKEACLKALGTGFSLPPSSIDVSAAPSVRIGRDVPSALKASQVVLSIADFHVGRGSPGAIAVAASIVPKIVRLDS